MSVIASTTRLLASRTMHPTYVFPIDPAGPVTEIRRQRSSLQNLQRITIVCHDAESKRLLYNQLHHIAPDISHTSNELLIIYRPDLATPWITLKNALLRENWATPEQLEQVIPTPEHSSEVKTDIFVIR